MTAFLLKRLAGGALTLFVIATLSFFITRFAPGSPFTSERKLPPEAQRNLERRHHLDKPLGVQYLLAMKGYLHGELGASFKYEGKSAEDIRELLRSRIDVVVTALSGDAEIWINRSQNSGHWLDIALQGTKSNRDGIGARIKLVTKTGGAQYNHMTTSVGYASSSDGSKPTLWTW